MSAHAPLPESCPNCATKVAGPYCFHCGQKVEIETPTLWEFIHEYLHHYVALEGTLTRTLWLLVTRPGKLTTEYLAGRRASYIKPLQLYLTISFVFFIALAFRNSLVPEQTRVIALRSNTEAAEQVLGGSGQPDAERRRKAEEVRAILAQRGIQEPPEGMSSDLGPMLKRHPWLAALGDRVERRQRQFRDDPKAATREMGEAMRHNAPYGVFALMPIAAFLLWLMYRRRGLRYGAHLVFAFHLHAFIFLLFLLTLLPLPLGLPAALAALVYLVVALRQMYGGRWLPQVLRAGVLLACYGCFALATLVVMSIAAYLG